MNGNLTVVDVGTGRATTTPGSGHYPTAIGAGRVGPRPVAALGDGTGEVWAWYLDTLDPVGPPARSGGEIAHLQIVETDGGPAVVLVHRAPSGAGVTTCSVLDPAAGTIVPGPGVPGRVVGLGRMAGRTCAAVEVVAADETHCTVQLFDLDTATPLSASWRFATSRIRRVVVVPTGTDVRVLVVGDSDELWVRELGDPGRPDAAPLCVVSRATSGSNANVAATIAARDGRPVLVVGDRTGVRTLEPATGETLVTAGDTTPVAVATTARRGRPAAVVALRDSGLVEVRDLRDGRRTAALFADSPVTALGSTSRAGMPLVFGRGLLGPRVWDSRSWRSLPEWREAGRLPTPVAALRLGDRTLLVTTRSADGETPAQVGSYDLATGEPAGPSIAVPGTYIHHAAAAVVRGCPVAVTSSLAGERFDDSVRAWDLRTGRELPGIPGPGVAALAVSDARDGPRLFVARYNGIEEWEMPGPDPPRRLRLRRRQPRQIRVATGMPAATALLVRPNGELVAARGDTLVPRPFAADPRPIRLGSPVVGLAVSADDPDVVLVATEDGVVAIEVL